jgi:hypothetical protein
MGTSRTGPALAGLAFLGTACATVTLPAPEVAERARKSETYSASLRVSLHGPELRARTRVLLAFRRPDSLRIELPGPMGARLVAVTRGGALHAVFSGERAVFEGAATPETLEELLGVSLSPGEMMDLLVGTPSGRVRDYTARWGTALPREIEARLPDGARLKVTVEEPVTGASLPELAFEPPPHDGYRQIDAAEARRLWSAR